MIIYCATAMSLDKPNVGSCMHEFKVNRKKAFSLLIITALLLSSLVVLINIPPAQAEELLRVDWEDSGGSDVTDGGKLTGSNGSPTVVTGSYVYKGTYALEVNSHNEYAYKVENLSGLTRYVSFVVNASTIPDTNAYSMNILSFYKNSSGNLYHVGLSAVNVDGTVFFQLTHSMTSGGNTTAVEMAVNTAYHFTIGYNNSALDTLYLDGELIATYETSGAMPDGYMIGGANPLSKTFYVDDVVITDSYTPPEEDTTAPSFGSITANSTMPSTGYELSCSVTDASGVDFYMWSVDEGEGYVNGSWLEWASNPVTYTDTWESTATTAHAKLYANDTVGNVGVSNEATFNIASIYTANAASGYWADIQAAVDDVEANGTDGVGIVYLPAGNFSFVNIDESWSGTEAGRVTVSGGIQIIGASASRNETGYNTEWNTILYLPWDVPGTEANNGISWFKFTGGNTSYLSRISNIMLQGYRSFNASSVQDQCAVRVVTGGEFRIDHCYFEHTTLGVQVWGAATHGLIDHTYLVNPVATGAWGMGDSTVQYGVVTGRDYPSFSNPYNMYWDNNTQNVLGQYTTYSTIIENCYFEGWRHCLSSNNGAHQVLRYSVIANDQAFGSIDAHGWGVIDEEGVVTQVGTRATEVYGCQIVDAVEGGGYAAQIRGGAGIFTNNTIGGGEYLIGIALSNESQIEMCQVKDLYIWNNTFIQPLTNVTGLVEEYNYHLHAPDWDGGWTEYTYPHPLTLSDEITEFPEDTYTLVVSSVTPEESSTLESSTLNYEFTTSGNDTLSVTQVALYYSNYTQVDSNQTSLTGTFNDLVNETYIIACSVTGVNGAADYLEVSFTVAFVEDTYTLEISSVSPEENATITSSTLNYEFTNTGNDTVSTVQVALYLSNGTQVGTNQTSLTGSFTGLTNNTYMLAASVAGDHGASDYETVVFTVAIPPDTTTLETTINNPQNTTYTNPSITISITTTTNGTNPITVWNIQFSNGTWLYTENQTYTVATSVIINENVTATLHVWANNTELNSDTANVTFTVYITPENPTENTIDLIMFTLPLLFGFIFSILALKPRSKEDKQDQPVNWTGILFATISMILWWVYGVLWPAVATSSVYVPFAWLWFTFGFIFLAVLIAYSFVAIKDAVDSRQPDQLVIRERRGEDDYY